MKMRVRRQRGGFFVMDLMLAIALGLVLLMAISGAVLKQAQGEKRLAAVRTAARGVEEAMLKLQNGEALPAGMAVRKLPEAAPTGLTWVRVSAPAGAGNGAAPAVQVVGLVRAELVPVAAEGGGR